MAVRYLLQSSPSTWCAESLALPNVRAERRTFAVVVVRGSQLSKRSILKTRRTEIADDRGTARATLGVKEGAGESAVCEGGVLDRTSRRTLASLAERLAPLVGAYERFNRWCKRRFRVQHSKRSGETPTYQSPCSARRPFMRSSIRGHKKAGYSSMRTIPGGFRRPDPNCGGRRASARQAAPDRWSTA